MSEKRSVSDATHFLQNCVEILDRMKKIHLTLRAVAVYEEGVINIMENTPFKRKRIKILQQCMVKC